VERFVCVGLRRGLLRLPVGGGERGGGRTDGAFGRVARGQGDRHIGGRLRREYYGERGRPAGLGRRQACHRRHRDPDGVVVRVGDRDIARINAVVGDVGAGRGRRDDGVGDLAVVQRVVDAGYGRRL